MVAKTTPTFRNISPARAFITQRSRLARLEPTTFLMGIMDSANSSVFPVHDPGTADDGMSTWMLSSLLALMALTSSSLSISASYFWRSVEVCHPMYAVLAQECVVLVSLAWVMLGTLIAAATSMTSLANFFGEIIFIATGLHQASWLVLTLLR